MPDTLFDDLPILRELGDDLRAACAEGDAAPAPAPRRPRRRRRLLLRAAAVGAAAIAVFAALELRDDPKGALDAVAALAAERPALGAGEYSYVRESRPGDPASDSPATTREWWIAADGSGRYRERWGAFQGTERPVQQAAARWRRTRDGGWVRDVRFGPGGFDRVDALVSARVFPRLRIADLPDAPEALEAALRDMLDGYARDDDPESGFAPQTNTPPSQQLFTVIQQALVHPLVAPGQRAALFRVAAGLDGVRVDEDARDPSGRPAVAVTLPRPGIRMDVFVDPGTSAVLATRWSWPDGMADTRTYAGPEVVGSLSARGTP